MRNICWVLCLWLCMGCRESTLERGQRFLAAQNYEKAQEALTLSIQEDETHWEAYYGRAQCETALLLATEALADYEKAYLMHPSVETCTGLGKGYADEREWEKAKDYLNRAIEMDADYADAQMNLGLIYVKEEAFAKALPYLLKAKAQFKQMPDELSMALMLVYFETGNDPACLEIIRKFKSSDTVSVAPYEYHGQIFLRKNQYAQALKQFNAALAIDSTARMARRCRADTYAGLKQYDLEVRDRSHLIHEMEAWKGNTYLIGQTYFYRGIAKANAGDNRGALQDFNTCMAMSGEQAGTYFSRAITKIYLHDFSGALRDYQKATRLAPDVAFEDSLTVDPTAFPEFLRYCSRRGVHLAQVKLVNI